MLLTYVISAAGIFCKRNLGVIELADTHECKSFIRTIPEVLQSLLVYKKAVSIHIIQFTSTFKSNIMNFLPLFFFVILASLQPTSAAGQSRSALRNVYRAVKGMNRDLQTDSWMERLASQHGCVRKHSQHINSKQDQAILDKYWNTGSNIVCASHKKDRGAQGWRQIPEHYETIMNNDRVGCSAPKDCDCAFCYFSNSQGRSG